MVTVFVLECNLDVIDRHIISVVAQCASVFFEGLHSAFFFKDFNFIGVSTGSRGKTKIKNSGLQTPGSENWKLSFKNLKKALIYMYKCNFDGKQILDGTRLDWKQFDDFRKIFLHLSLSNDIVRTGTILVCSVLFGFVHDIVSMTLCTILFVDAWGVYM